MNEINPIEFDRFTNILRKASGIALKPNQQYLVEARLSPLIKRLGLSGFGDLFTHCERNPSALQQVVDLMTTNETLWFRDPNAWAMLEDFILPKLITQLEQGKKEIRIWSAASSTGQEAYSLSILIGEILNRKGKGIYRKRFSIVGTDISTEAVAHAKAGIYDAFTVSRGVDEHRLKAYFDLQDANYVIKAPLRENIQFQTFNLMGSLAMLGQFDLVLCRNVAIYFTEEVKVDLMNRIGRQLSPDGFFMLGSTESLFGHETPFQQQQAGMAIYYDLQ